MARPTDTETADAAFAGRARKKIPYEFVLEALADLDPVTRPMFGCTSIYVGDRIVMALREKSEGDPDNGVWIATQHDHHDALRKELPSMRSITVFGVAVSGWQVLPADSDDFEESALRACEMVRRGDPRVGKVPGAKKKSAPKKAAAKKPAAKKPAAKKPAAKKPAAKKPAAKKPAAKKPAARGRS